MKGAKVDLGFRFWTGMAVAAACAATAPAQYPGQVQEKKPSAPEVRAIAVLEWTGDLAHPHASRLIPVSVWDGQQLQDGSIYLARPQPLALDSETEYELQKDGRNIGYYIVHEAAQKQDSWIGLGAFKALPKPPSRQQLARAEARRKVDMDDAESDVPILHRKYHPDEKGSGSGSGAGTANGPAPDHDRPTLHRGTNAGSGPAAGGGSTAGNSAPGNGDNNPSAPPPDPDRPRLTADEDSASSGPSQPGQAKEHDPGDEQAYVSDLPNISDPDRPRLRYGAPVESGPAVKPTLVGLPPEMEQDVAISDLQAIKEHPWDFTWANPGDEGKMKADLEETARQALGLERTPAAKPAKATTRHRSGRRAATPPAAPAPLLDEQFRVFQLQYGAGATMVFSAHTAGSGADRKFVTLIAQPDLYGGVVVLLKNVTNGANLDGTPRMRLIDAVDALADNRGELLFELRGETQREFALYRVLRGQATKIFTSSPSFWTQAAGN